MSDKETYMQEVINLNLAILTESYVERSTLIGPSGYCYHQF